MDFLFKGKLTTLDKMIAKVIYDEPNSVNELTIIEFANYCNVSPSKITKYCQKIGITGYKGLKSELVKHSFVKNGTNQSFEYQKKNIDLFFSSFDFAKLEKLKSLIKENKKIIFYGKGPSYLLSEFYAPRLRVLIGKEVVNYIDDQLMKFELSDTTKSQLIIFLTASGKTNSIIEMITYASQNKNNTIVVLSDSLSDGIIENVDLNINMLDCVDEFDYEIIRGRTLLFTYFEILIQEFNNNYK